MTGKGSKRRPQDIPDKQMQDNLDRIFGKSSSVELVDERVGLFQVKDESAGNGNTSDEKMPVIEATFEGAPLTEFFGENVPEGVTGIVVNNGKVTVFTNEDLPEPLKEQAL